MSQEQMIQYVLSLDESLKLQEQTNRTAVSLPVEKWFEIAKIIRNDSELEFDMLDDHAAVDWPQENQIELVYQFYSIKYGHHLMVSVRVSRQKPIAPSLHSLWPIAEWQEREVFDLFGVNYAGHPDLRRLFLEDDWVGHPLLKDYQDEFILERPW